MKLLDDDALERSGTVANCQMNRQRTLAGSNGYTKELCFNPLVFLLNTAEVKVRWLDLCCGEGTALAEAAQSIHDHEMGGKCEIIGVDLVVPQSRTKPQFPCLRFVEASLTRWQPIGRFDLITCVHGLHYVGDKLGLITRAVSWLTDNGQFLANLDLNNFKFADGGSAGRVVAREMRRNGLDYDSRRKLLRCSGHRKVRLPFQYLGANDQAGPNYTKQPAIDSYYVRLKDKLASE